MREKKETVEEVGNRYISIMYAITGRDIRERTRERYVVNARNMVFLQMLEDGFTQTQVGKFIGFDHSSVFHGKEQVKLMLLYSRLYPNEMAVWDKFQKSIAI